MSYARLILKSLLPHGVVQARRNWLAKSRHQVPISREEFHDERRARIASAESASPSSRQRLNGMDYDRVVAFLAGRGIPEHHLREGSVPPNSLEFIRQSLIEAFRSGEPLRILHVGNFVGVSLAYVAAAACEIHGQSLVVAVDPNLRHRNVPNPQGHVSALLAQCGLQNNVLMVCGYSGGKSVSNDGVVFGDYDPAESFDRECACENAISKLQVLGGRSFHVALVDGNHEAKYVARELEAIRPMLRAGGFVVLDDVDSAWQELRDLYVNASSMGFTPQKTDGRVGIVLAS